MEELLEKSNELQELIRKELKDMRSIASNVKPKDLQRIRNVITDLNNAFKFAERAGLELQKAIKTHWQHENVTQRLKDLFSTRVIDTGKTKIAVVELPEDALIGQHGDMYVSLTGGGADLIVGVDKIDVPEGFKFFKRHSDMTEEDWMLLIRNEPFGNVPMFYNGSKFNTSAILAAEKLLANNGIKIHDPEANHAAHESSITCIECFLSWKNAHIFILK